MGKIPYFLAVLFFSLLSLRSYSAPLPDCKALVLPSRVEVRNLQVDEVILSLKISNRVKPKLLEELKLAIIREDLYPVKEDRRSNYETAIVALPIEGDPAPKIFELRFRELAPGTILASSLTGISNNRVHWYYDLIAGATFTQEKFQQSIEKGFLKGHQLIIKSRTIVKLAIKHNLNLSMAMEAFEQLKTRPVRVIPEDLIKNPDSVRYLFVTELKDKTLIKVVFDSRPETAEDSGAVFLVSAYPVPQEDLIEYQQTLNRQNH